MDSKKIVPKRKWIEMKNRPGVGDKGVPMRIFMREKPYGKLELFSEIFDGRRSRWWKLTAIIDPENNFVSPNPIIKGTWFINKAIDGPSKGVPIIWADEQIARRRKNR